MSVSLSDYATHERSLYPSLWNRCFFAFASGLGHTSNKAVDFATGTTSVLTNYDPARWGYDNGVPYLEGGANDSTNCRARFNWQSSNNPISMAAWIYWTGQATNAMPFTIGGTDAYLRVVTGTSIPDFTVNNGNGRATGVTAVAVNGWTHLCGVRDSGELRLYVNGVLDKTTTYTAGAVGTGTTIGVFCLQDTSVASNYFAGRVDDAFAWSRPLSVDEIKLLASARNIAFTPRRRLYTVLVSTAEEAATGTVSATLSSATSAASAIQTFTGAAPCVAGADSSSASGKMAVAGTALSPLGLDTSSAAGGVGVTGTASSSLAGATSSAAGLLTLQGSAAVALSSAVLAAAGAATNSGVCAATLGDATASASGQCLTGNSGPVDSQLDNATSQCSGLVTVTGACAGSASCQGVSTGSVEYTGAVASALDPATPVSSGLISVQGSAAASTSASSAAVGQVGVIAVGTMLAGSATSLAVGQIPTSGPVAVTLQGAFSLAVGSLIQVDIELDAVVDLAQCDGVVSSPWLDAKVPVARVKGKKLWR